MSRDWCAKISDSVLINDLAIPGTHDAAAWTHYWNWSLSIPGTWAQRKSISEQLDLGVRVLDLRVGYASSSYTFGITSFVGMYHGPVYLRLTLEEVLDDIKRWLAANPREFVILIFQQQGKPGQRDVAPEVKRMVNATFSSNLYSFPSSGSNRWPSVGQLRGKVMAMGRLRSDVDGFYNVRDWLTTGNNTDGAVIPVARANNLSIYLQDRYSGLSSIEGFESMEIDNRLKFEKVMAVARTTVSDNILKINHMSYSNLRYQPWRSGEGVNRLLRDKAPPLRVKGVLMMDDADQLTIQHILQNNR